MSEAPPQPLSEPRPQPSRAWLPLVVFALAAYRSLPVLMEGWEVDVYARGGMIACGLWLVPALYRVCVPSGIGTGFLWMLLALVCGVAGAGSSLRVLDHISLLCAVAALARPRGLQLAWAPLGLSWLPAAGWFVSRLTAGGLAGWERPLLAGLGVILFFIPELRRKNP